jgi:hypothetical protein
MSDLRICPSAAQTLNTETNLQRMAVQSMLRAEFADFSEYRDSVAP